MPWFACKGNVQHGLKTGQRYCPHASMSFVEMANHSPMELNHTQSVFRDAYSYNEHLPQQAAHSSVSQGSLNWETQSTEPSQSYEASEVQLSMDTFMSLYGKCRKERDLGYARRLLVYAQNAGLEDEAVIGYHLVLMFLECGSLVDAHQLFNRLGNHTEQCWTSLIQAYIEFGKPQTALNLFQKLQQNPGHTSKHAITAALRACTKLKDLDHGRMTHNKVAEETLEMDQFVSNTLVDMYCKCSSLDDAQVVFNTLQIRDSVSWNALIGGYAEHGPTVSLERCLEQMKRDGISPDTVTYLAILKAFERDDLPNRVLELHAEIVKAGFDRDLNVGNNLVHVYAKLGSITEAQQVICQQSPPNVISWTALIAGHIEYGNMEDALTCSELMENNGIYPSDATFICMLRACGSVGDGIVRGRKIHAEIVQRAFEMKVPVGNILVDMYFKCGSLLDAQKVFDKLTSRDVISWTTLLSGYVEHGFCKEALSCLHQMQAEGVTPNATSYLCGLKACQTIKDLFKGQELHAEIVKEQFEEDLFLGNTLVDFYVSCGLSMEAKEVFDDLPVRLAASWNTLISGFAEQGDAEMTLHCLKEMELEGTPPTATTFLCSVKACGSVHTLFLGQEIHTWATKKGFECENNFLGNSLVDMYSRCGLLLEAQKVFYSSGERDIVSWNSLLGGYSDAGFCSEALDCLKRMHMDGIAPNAPTFLILVKSCKCLGFLDRGHEVHTMLIKAGFENGPFLTSALVDMYAMHGKLADAENVFHEQQVLTVVTWTALIVGYTEHGFGEKALDSYAQMQQEGIPPDDALYICALKACGNIGAIDKGRNIYSEVTKVGTLEESMLCSSTLCTKAAYGKQNLSMNEVNANALSLHNVLVDMFCKCGSLSDAQKVFDAIPTRDSVTWNAMIAGHALLGNPEFSISLFDKMKSEGVEPDAVTYANVLTACNHVGFNESGQTYIDEMSKVYGLIPLRQHYNCVVDLLARAGQLNIALALVEKFPFQPDLVTWTTVLGNCRQSGNVELGRHVFECSVSLFENQLSGFVLTLGMYKNAEMWAGAKDIDVMRERYLTGIG